MNPSFQQMFRKQAEDNQMKNRVFRRRKGAEKRKGYGNIRRNKLQIVLWLKNIQKIRPGGRKRNGYRGREFPARLFSDWGGPSGSAGGSPRKTASASSIKRSGLRTDYLASTYRRGMKCERPFTGGGAADAFVTRG